MCRITAIVELNSNINYDIDAVIAQMRDTMVAGGPDDAGNYISKEAEYTIALGHRRLSIIDVSEAGHQPMLSDTGNTVIAFNGEMYNYREVKKELIEKGRFFRTHSDTEVLLQAYEEWGIDSVNKFIGMFAFILYDKLKRQLYIVRDRAGVKPVYYYRSDNTLLFGSELKSFHPHPEFKKEINVDALASYLQLGYIAAPHSIFNNVLKIMPGHYLKIDLVNKTTSSHQYWSAIEAYNQPLINDITHNELLKETESLLSSACNYRMVADVPVGVFLSGGFDSSLVTALLQKDSMQKIKTFSIGFREEGFDEAPHAKKVSDHLGTDHTEYYCSHKDAVDIIPTLPQVYDEPFGDSSAIPTILVSRIARQSVKVALSADAGDELFGGYHKYTSIINLHKKLSYSPGRLNSYAGKFIESLQPENFSDPSRNSLGKKATRFSKILQAKNMGESLYWLSTISSEKQVGSMLGKPFSKQSSNFDSARSFGRNADNINTMLAVDYLTYLPDDILTKVDRATMSVSLEGREPLLDHRLLEWMARIPGNRKMHAGIQKYILKEIMYKYLPKQMMDRPKMGFGVPISMWFKNELKNYFEHYFSKEKLQQHGLLNYELIQKKKQGFLDGKSHYITELWYLLMFQLWYEKWMN
jgi:asparagine synthase (glutamine-hydrolysing)